MSRVMTALKRPGCSSFHLDPFCVGTYNHHSPVYILHKCCPPGAGHARYKHTGDANSMPLADPYRTVYPPAKTKKGDFPLTKIIFSSCGHEDPPARRHVSGQWPNASSPRYVCMPTAIPAPPSLVLRGHS